MLWLQKNMPTEIPKVLRRARQIYSENLDAPVSAERTRATGP